ncbi:MAG: toxin-antitoxin system HicB family antitoxin [Arachnia sp.]
MTLEPHLALVRDQLDAAGAAMGGPVEEAAGRLTVLLEPALRLALQSALAEAAADLSVQLAGTARVDVRLDPRGPVLTATLEAPATETASLETTPPLPADEETRPLDGTMARFTLRLPEELKARVDDAATAAGVSTNSWLVRAAERSLTSSAGAPLSPTPSSPPGRRLSGWLA